MNSAKYLSQFNHEASISNDDCSFHKTKSIIIEGTAENTIKAYKKDLKYFFTWAKLVTRNDNLQLPIKSELIIKFISEHLVGLDSEIDNQLVESGKKAQLGTHSLNTVRRRVSALSVFHNQKHLTPNPCSTPQISELLRKARIRASNRNESPSKKKAITLNELELMLSTCDNSMTGIRDHALLLFGFSSGGRRASEIANATYKKLTEVQDNFIYTLARSKTDQVGYGLTVPIKGRSAESLRTWLAKTNIREGNLFRGVTKYGSITNGIQRVAISRIIKKRAQLSGLNPDNFSSHSMRAGFITECGKQNINLGDVMAMSGHKTMSVAMSYFQTGNILNNVAGDIANANS